MWLVIPKSLALNQGIGDRVVRVYLQLSNYLDDNGVINKPMEDIAFELSCSIDSMNNNIRELVNLGYLTKDGDIIRVSGNIVIAGTSSNGNKPDKKKVPSCEFIEMWNKTYSTRHRDTPRLREMLRGRLETFTYEEIVKGLLNRYEACKDDDFFTADNNKFLNSPYSYVRDDEKVARYLAMGDALEEKKKEVKKEVKKFKFG